MATKEYKITFNRDGVLGRTGHELTADMDLTDEQLAGLVIGLNVVIDHTPYNMISHLSVENLETEHLISTIAHHDPYTQYQVGQTDYLIDFINKLKRMKYSVAISKSFWTKNNGIDMINYTDITKRYSMILKAPMISYLYQFNSIGFLQGFLTACQWLRINCKTNLLLFEGETQLNIE